MKDANIVPTMNVVVAYGGGGDMPVCCMGTVVQRADNGSWWIDVYTGAENPLPQMFQAEHILGIASLGMTYVRAALRKEERKDGVG